MRNIWRFGEEIATSSGYIWNCSAVSRTHPTSPKLASALQWYAWMPHLPFASLFYLWIWNMLPGELDCPHQASFNVTQLHGCTWPMAPPTNKATVVLLLQTLNGTAEDMRDIKAEARRGHKCPLTAASCGCGRRPLLPYSERTVSTCRLGVLPGHLAGVAKVLRD